MTIAGSASFISDKTASGLRDASASFGEGVVAACDRLSGEETRGAAIYVERRCQIRIGNTHEARNEPPVVSFNNWGHRRHPSKRIDLIARYKFTISRQTCSARKTACVQPHPEPLKRLLKAIRASGPQPEIYSGCDYADRAVRGVPTRHSGIGAFIAKWK